MIYTLEMICNVFQDQFEFGKNLMDQTHAQLASINEGQKQLLHDNYKLLQDIQIIKDKLLVTNEDEAHFKLKQELIESQRALKSEQMQNKWLIGVTKSISKSHQKKAVKAQGLSENEGVTTSQLDNESKECMTINNSYGTTKCKSNYVTQNRKERIFE